MISNRAGVYNCDQRLKGLAMEKITTWLWFDTEAEEAAQFYTSIFQDSRVPMSRTTARLGLGRPGR